MMFVRLTITEHQNAAQKVGTENPSTSRPTSRNRSALITTIPSPIVTTMKGSVNRTSSGFRNALNRLMSTTTARSEPGLSYSTPLTSRVARITPSASTSQRTSRLTIGWFFTGIVRQSPRRTAAQ